MSVSGKRKWTIFLQLLLLLCPIIIDGGFSPPELVLERLSFVESPQYSVALPGDSVFFSCKTNLPSTTPQNVSWLHNGKVIESRRNNGHHLTFRVSRDQYEGQTGTYQCVAGAQGSALKLASLPAQLIIAKIGQFAQPAKTKSEEVFQGNDVIIPCPVPDSNPPAFVQFIRDGQTVLVNEESGGSHKSLSKNRILNGDTLLLTDVGLDDAGNYSCVATNHITDERRVSSTIVTLRVGVPGTPQKSRVTYTPNENYRVKLGERVSIACAASGVPKPEIIWTRSEAGTVSGNSAHNSSRILTSRNGVLDIYPATQSDTGHYMCAVFNGGRRFVRRTSVSVLVPPSFTKVPSSSPTLVSPEMELGCAASGSPPPVITWTLNGFPVPNSTVDRITGTLKTSAANPSLYSGIYQCFASNAAGQNYTSALVRDDSKVYENPDDDEIPDPEEIPDYLGYAVRSPTKPNATQLSAESALINWDLDTPRTSAGPWVPVRFFKIQFREFFRASGKSPWHTLDEEIGPEVRAFEVLGLHSDRKYRFRVVVVFENNDSRVGPLSARFKLDAKSRHQARPRPPRVAPEITNVLPLGPTTLRIGWKLTDAGNRKRKTGTDDDIIEGYFIHVRPTTSVEKYRKITIIGPTSHSHIVDALIPGTQYEIKVQSFNLAGVSPLSGIGRQVTRKLPPEPGHSETSRSSNLASTLDTTLGQDVKNEDVLKYLMIGGCLAAGVLVFMATCSAATYLRRKRKNTAAGTGNGVQMAEIREKYEDTARQISQKNLEQMFTSSSTATVTTPDQGFGENPDGKNNFSVSYCEDSWSRLNQSSLNSLGQEEYSDEPSRISWRRRRKSEESFI